MQQTLYRKYRPQDFDNFYGNSSVIQTIKNSLLNGQMSHAYLFSGPRGTGKTSLARLISKSLNCSDLKDGYNPCSKCSSCLSISKGTFPDMIEIDAASNRGIDEIREIKERVQYKPLVGKYKVYIIDEVHMLTKEAFNAILKTLEEPPKHAIFILATTEPSKIPDTVHSRCQRYLLQLLDRDSVLNRMKYISKSENRELEEDLFALLYRESGASMRDAISLLEKILISFPEGKISLKEGEDALGVVPKEVLSNLFNSYVEKDSTKMLEIIDDSWMKGYRIESLMKDLAFHIRENIGGKGIGDIEKIFTCLNEFKWEDNKRVVGYVLANRLMPLNTLNESKDKVVSRDSNRVEKEVEIKVKPINKKAEERIKDEQVVEVIKEEPKTKRVVMKKESVVLPIQSRPLDSAIVKEEKVEKKSSAKKIGKDNKNIEEIEKLWPTILSEVKETKLSLMIFLMSAKIEAFDNNILSLCYDKEHSFHRESISKSENKIVLEDILSKVIGNSVKVNIEGKGEEKVSNNFSSTVEDLLREEGMI